MHPIPLRLPTLSSLRAFHLVAMLGLGGLLFAGCEDDPQAPAVPAVPSGPGWELLHEAGDRLGLTDVWASAADDMVAVGEQGRVYLFDGEGWSRLDAPFADDLVAVLGLGRRSFLVAGNSPLLRTYDAGTWSSRETSSIAQRSLWAAAAADVYVVGQFGRLHHFDGSAWAIVRPDEVPLEGLTRVWGLRADDVFAGGSNRLFRYDGAVWSEIILGFDAEVVALAGLDNGDFFAVLANGKVYANFSGAWSFHPLTLSSAVVDAWCPRAGEMEIVTAAGDVHRFAQDSWTRTDGPDVDVDVVAAWGVEGSLFLVDRVGSVLRYDSGAIAPHSLVDAPVDDLQSAWTDGARELVAVRTAYGDFLHQRHGRWFTSALDGLQARQVWGTGEGELYALATTGALAFHDGGEASAWQSPPPGEFGYDDYRGIGGSGADNVVCVGSDGLVTTFDGEQWVEHTLDGVPALDLVWTENPSAIFVASRDRVVATYDGGAWQVFPTIEVGGVVRAVSGESADAPRVILSNERVLRFEEGAWLTIREEGDFGYRFVVPVTGARAVTLRSDGEVGILDDEGWTALDRSALQGQPAATTMWAWSAEGILLAGARGYLARYGR